MYSRAARRVIPKSGCCRYYTKSSSDNVLISHFLTRKKGTGSGPFIELPEFVPLQDSILIRIPSSCTVYGRLDKISAITSDINNHEKPFLAQDFDSTKQLTMVTTGEQPVNVLMASHTPLSNIVVLKMDNYKKGIHIPSFYQASLCFSGDLHMNNNGELKGMGIVALAGKGPIFQMILKPGEKNLVAKESILAYDSQVKCQFRKVHSSFNIPEKVDEWLAKNASQLYESVKFQYSRLFDDRRIFCELQGPGSVFLQTNFVPGSKRLSKSDLLKAFE